MYARCGTIAQSEHSTCQSNGYKFYDMALGEESSYDFNAAIAAKRVAINGSAANTCLAAYSGLSCTNFVDPQITAACAHIYTGMVAMGGTCEDSIECTSGFCQQNAGSATCAGVCTAFIAEGVGCAATSSGCDSTKDFCGQDETHMDPTCLPLPGNGAPCAVGQCATGLVCNNQTCATPGTAGAACVAGSCGAGLYCPSTSSQGCQPLVKSGQVCTDPGSCEDGTVCNSFGKPSGTCAPLLDVGAACDPTAPACAQDDVCDQTKHVCALNPLALTEGSTCTPGEDDCTGTVYAARRCTATRRRASARTRSPPARRATRPPLRTSA